MKKTCSCVKFVFDTDVEMFFDIPQISCYACQKIFHGSFYGRYIGDAKFPNGEIGHIYSSKGLGCPHCGTEFTQHVFHHSLHNGESEEALETLISDCLESLK
jgi:hypothetical protein